MYTTLDQVVLVHREVYRPRPDDVVVYHRIYGGEDIFTLDNEPSGHTTEPVRYGLMYTDADERICIVPDNWDDNHMDRAWNCALPQDYHER